MGARVQTEMQEAAIRTKKTLTWAVQWKATVKD